MSDDRLYCVCRSKDDGRLMIGCDNCDYWYHGACISMNKQLSDTFDKFYCIECRDRDPSLKNQFHKQSTDYVISSSEVTNKQGTVKNPFYKESSKYVCTISSSEVTGKQGTVRKRSPSPQRSNKVIRFGDNIKLEKKDCDNETHDDQDETLGKKNDSSEINSEANSPPTENERASDKIERESEKETSRIDKGLRQCYQWKRARPRSSKDNSAIRTSWNVP
uniref:PHD-type domain-containing protein n=1 Tax=Tetranychus urticae TaxID=32264 RepID=T1KQN0_TETUR